MNTAISRRDVLKAFGVSAFTLLLGSSGGGNPQSQATGPIGYTLPPLPYSYDALEPVISKEILTLHHDKHHAGYVKGLNKALDKLAEARNTGDFSTITYWSKQVAFHGSGHILHSIYWENMSPKGEKEPQGKLMDFIRRDFGSFEKFKAHFIAATNAVEGSGWGVLMYEPVGKGLLILQAEKHENLTVWGAFPLLVCDVWEHAYYLQYKNNRAEYVDNFFSIINWSNIEQRLELVMKLL